MFKKFKDKLAEEVKSSPQRIQQFAQAAQAAVTSASSSISDITNNDLFSIGGDDTPTQNSPARPPGSLESRSALSSGDPSLGRSHSPYGISNDREATPTNDDRVHLEGDGSGAPPGGAVQRLRKLSTGSAASDVSFRLPSYDSPSMYHLQSDMEVSASEAESVPSAVGLERVTKEQVYAAFRRTQERYNKYRGRYADLARHYKILEKENTKARAVLVETQDKALRRISELREQCALEQSAKAHLESALRVELDEKNLKIEALNTKIKLLQSFSNEASNEEIKNAQPVQINNGPDGVSDVAPTVSNLIDLTENEKPTVNSVPSSEIAVLNNKIQKMEQLAAKYKESLKALKEKNAQLTTEIQIVSNELDKKGKENEQLQAAVKQLTDARQQIQELKENNKELQFTVDNFNKIKAEEVLAVKTQLDNALENIKSLNRQIDVFTKREEENAISLAENKFSIHKELESKEAEIKLLTNKLVASSNEVKSYELVTDELKQSLKNLEADKADLKKQISELESAKVSIVQLEQKIDELQKLSQNQEQKNLKMVEEIKCSELQMKQETAEKLAIIDRNNYLETRNQQLTEDNSKKNKQIVDLEKEILQNNSKNGKYDDICDSLHKEKDDALEQISLWQNKYNALESEIKEERVELVKLQSEIEKLLQNYEKLQLENIELARTVVELNEAIKLKDENIEALQMKVDDVTKQSENKLQLKIQELKEVTEKIINIEMEITDKIKKELKEEFKCTEISMRENYEKKIAELEHNLANENKLTDELTQLKRRIEQLLQEKNELETELRAALNNLSDRDVLNEKVKQLEYKVSQFNDYKSNHEKIKSENNALLLKVQSLEQENALSISKADQIVKEISDLQIELSEVKKSHDNIENEKDSLVEKIIQIEKSEASKNEKERKIYNETLEKNEEIKRNVEKLKQELESLMAEKHKLHNQVLEAQYDSKEKEAEITKFKENNEVWEQKLASILDENNILHEKCEKLKQDKDTFNENVLKMEQKLSEYEKKLKQHEESTVEKEFLDLRTSQLENDLQFANLERDKLLHENKLLKSQVSDLEKLESSKLKQLADNLERETHEKDQLNIKLSDYVALSEKENNENKENAEKIAKLEINLSELNTKYVEVAKEVETLNESAKTHLNERENWAVERNNFNDKIKRLTLVESELATLQQEYEKVKEDKSRLVSDIEGLQVHLTKVSKDNSQLNDKIREMIASDENVVTENSKDISHERYIAEIHTLKDNLRTKGDYIDDLERQNSILVEEKLELEDQLKSQNSQGKGDNNVRDITEKDLEITRLSEKNNNLLELKTQLESKLADMELMGRSGDSNVLHLEQKNEKLRLTNDKLERRLDEALVSLRHLRALEENTELEYLRNILYEYLTGTGAHSVTLAKVIAAVVKFDDRQTQLVLQREKERQGLLGQLGIL